MAEIMPPGGNFGDPLEVGSWPPHADELFPEVSSPPADPLEAEARAFGDALAEAAAKWAPGTASAPWEHWPHPPTSDAVETGMLSLGVVGDGRGVTMLVPGVGEANFYIGNPDNTVPLVRQRVYSTQHTQQRALEAEETARVHTGNQEKLEALAFERRQATNIALALATRAVGSVRPGLMSVTVYDPVGRAVSFSGLGALGKKDLYRAVVAQDGLSGLLGELEADIAARQAALEGYPMRELVARTGHAPIPWRVVALIGNGEPLSDQDQGRLAHVRRFSVDCGIMLIEHGYPMERTDFSYTQQIVVGAGPTAYAQTNSYAAEHGIRLDPPPPVELVRHTARAASAAHESTQPPSVRIDPTRPSQEYARMVAGHQKRVRDAKVETDRFNARHPYLHRSMLQSEVMPSVTGYYDFATQIAQNPALAITRVQEVFSGATVSVVAQAQAWAALGLLRTAPEHRAARRAGRLYAPSARAIIDPQLHGLADLVGVTRQRSNDIAESMQPYVGNMLPTVPLAWAFQLVSDAVMRAGWRPTERVSQRMIDALCLDIEQTFHTRLRDEHGRIIDPRLASCLSECRLLSLYGYDATLEPLKVLLTRRVHRRLERAPLDETSRAFPIYRTVFTHLDRIVRIPTNGEKARAGARSAVSRLGRVITRWRPSEVSDRDANAEDFVE